MKNQIKKILFLSLTAILAGCEFNTQNSNSNDNNIQDSGSEDDYIPSPNDRNWQVTSIDESLAVNIYLKSGYLSYEVKKDNKTVVDESLISIVTDATDFDSGVELYNEPEVNTISTSYEPISGSYSFRNVSYNEILIQLKDIEDMIWTVTFRAYDDGYAFRHSLSAVDGSEGELTFYGEDSTWTLPKNTTTYSMEFPHNDNHPYFSYEEYYQQYSVSGLMNKDVSMPFLYKTKDNIFSLISEAELIGSQFYGSFLTASDSSTIHTIPAYGAEEEGENGITVNYPFDMPWRVCPTGSLADIAESNLIEDVYGDVEYYKPSNYDSLTTEEKEIYNFDWVEPGIVAWNWLVYSSIDGVSQSNMSIHREYIDLASNMGWKYIILDGGWNSKLTDLSELAKFKEMMKYAESKNIKVIAWGNGLTDTNEVNMETTLDEWQSYGIAGVKLDFFDGQNGTLISGDCGESQATIKHMERIYQECAKRKMVVNVHGGNKPTGERRVYPNVLNREGIRGNEMKSMQARQLVTIPFIRGIVGPSDYTPVLNPLNGEHTTIGMQLAQCVLYESGLPSMADRPSAYYNTNAKDLLKALPATWDDLKYVQGDIEKDCVLARKKGDEWWVAGVTTNAKDFTFNLDFLDEGSVYKADIYKDGSYYDTLINEKKDNLSKASSITVHAAKYGGFTIRLTKVK